MVKIGIMLRHLNPGGHEMGTRIYTENVVNGILEADKTNEYVLIYKDENLLGTFSGYENVIEKVLKTPSKILWDQIGIPLLARKENLDLIFNPKFTVPLFTKRKTIFVMHGMEWYVYPEVYKWFDVHYIKFALPLYCKKADRVIAVSNQVEDEILKYIKVNSNKIITIHEAYNKIFHPIKEQAVLRKIKTQYNLPDNFILYVGDIFPSKNFGRLLKAYNELQKIHPIKLVVVGRERWKFEQDFSLIQDFNLEDKIIFTGHIPQTDLPAFYNLAKLFVFPSLDEGFGLPLVEAMACGCPVVASKTGALPEIGGDGAYYIDPYNIEEITNGMYRVLANDNLKNELIKKGFQQSHKFSWEKNVQNTLSMIYEVLDEKQANVHLSTAT